MKRQLIQEKLVIVSDIHIRYPDEQRYNLLLSLIDQVDRSICQDFVLLGDIFAFCFGPNPYCRALFKELGAALSNLVANGVVVTFIQGNHEFAMPAMRWEGVQFPQETSKCITIPGSRDIWITHGDLISAPWHYHLFRKFIKSRFVELSCRWLLPQEWFYRRCLSFASYSRSQDDFRHLDHQKILRGARAWLTGKGGRIGYFGHFHVPYFVTYGSGPEDAGSLVLMSCTSWDTPNAMGYSPQSGFARYFFNRETGQFERVAAKPFAG